MFNGDGEGTPSGCNHMAFVLDVLSDSFSCEKACCTWRKLSWSVDWTEEGDGSEAYRIVSSA